MSRGSRRQLLLARLAAVGGSALIISLSIFMTAGIAIAADSTDNVPTGSLGQNEWSSVAPSNPMNVTSNNGTYVTTNVTDADQGYGFGFNIPAGSIIGGITVKVDAKSTDNSGCQLAVRLSGNTASSFTGRQNRDLTQTETILTYGGNADTWGQVWDPTMFGSKFRLEIRNLNGDNCVDGSTTSVDWIAVSVTYTTMNSGDENAELSGTICKSGDFNFIIDQSGSIGQQGDIPSNLQQLKDGINGFVAAFQSQAGASGIYAGTKFSGSSATNITSGYVSAATFTTAVNALTDPSGLTPTGVGIDAGSDNGTGAGSGDRAGIPNVMFVVTDGSPNKPNTHGDDLGNPDTWLQGANAAIGAADNARDDGYVVKAVYLSTASDPGDTSLPFSAAGDAQWATNVMDNIGGGDHFDADFTGFINDLFEAIDCPPPPPAVVKIDKTPDHANPVNAGEGIGFNMVVWNEGPSAATVVKLSDVLPTNAGLNWTIQSQGAGWGGTCAIAAGSLTCGGAAGKTIPANLTKANSTFTVHITSTTNKDTGGTCPGSGTVDNTGNVTSANGGNPNDSAFECVKAPIIKIDKTADHANPVSAGDQIGFLLTVYNDGAGTATGVKLTDTLPTNAGLNWSIAGQGTGWAGAPCVIDTGVLKCGGANGVAVPANLTKGNSTFTVHITSTTTKDTAGTCPGTGTVSNTGSVTSGNDGTDNDTAVECVAKAIIKIDKTPDHDSPVSAGDLIGFTLTVYNDGAGNAAGVKLTDTLPTNAGLSWTVANTGAGWGSPCVIDTGVLKCGGANGVTVPGSLTKADSTFTVHITSTTTKDTAGTCPDTGKVTNMGTVTTSNDGSDNDTAVECVAKAVIKIDKTPDHANPVNAGDQIGFTLTVFNDGAGAAAGAKLTDTLPTNPGLTWSIAGQGLGWADSCIIDTGVLKCGGANGVTVPGSLTKGNSTFTVHITASTTSSTAGTCPGTGTVTNLGTVTTGNDGTDNDTAVECVQAGEIQIVKTPDHQSPVNAGDQIGFTLTVFNAGPGNATGVKLTDVLPTNPGLSWTVANTGAGWGSDCTIVGPNLTCGGVGGVIVPGNLTQGASTFTVHITSTTTAATGGICPGTGTVSNTGHVTSANDGEDQSTAVECVEAADIKILKTADHAGSVNAGDPIGFTVTVWNAGPGDAKGVTLHDLLPVKAGLAWTIATEGAGWGDTCDIVAGSLDCGPVTVPGGTTQGASTFTVHITSPTTKDTAGSCPGTGTVSNKAEVDTTNDGSGESTAVECVQAGDIKILKTADHLLPVSAGDQIGFTITVWNAGGGTATGVKLGDVLPTDAGTSWTIESQGDGWADSCAIVGPNLTCGGAAGVSVPGGTTFVGSSYTVHIVSPTTALTAGDCPGTGEVANTGSVTTTNDGSGQSSATECVQSVDIRVAKIADDDAVVAGQQIGFTIVLWNPGLGNAAGVKLSDLLPPDAGLNWAIAPTGVGQGWTGAGATCAIDAGTLTCGGVSGVNVPGSLSQGASLFTVHIVSTTTAATANQSPVENTACVASSNGGDGCASDDVDVYSLTLEKANDAPVKQLELPDGSVVGVPTQDEGKIVTYTLTYDVGNTAVHDAVLTDVLPAGVTFQATPAPTSTNPELTFGGYNPATRTLTWTAATLSTDGSVSYTAKIDTGANKLEQPLINHAAIESEETPEDTAESEVFVPAPPQVETHVVTAPPTDVLNKGEGTTKGSSLLIVLAALGLVVIAVSFITPVPAAVRRRNRRR